MSMFMADINILLYTDIDFRTMCKCGYVYPHITHGIILSNCSVFELVHTVYVSLEYVVSCMDGNTLFQTKPLGDEW